MHPLSLFVIILFWAPTLIPLYYSLLHDLAHWQSRAYSSRDLMRDIMWDFQDTYRTIYGLGVKTIIFAICSIIFIDPSSPLPALGILAAFIYWVVSSYATLETIIRAGLPRLVLDWRSISAISAITILVVTLAVITMIPLWQTYLSGLISFEQTGFFPQTIGNGYIILPDIILYLVFAAWISIATDLLMPILVTAWIWLTMPLQWLVDKWRLTRLTDSLVLFPHLNVVVVIGSKYKSTVAELLYELSVDTFDTELVPFAISNPRQLANAIDLQVSHHTEVLILEYHTYGATSLKQLFELIKPNIVVFSGSDDSGIALSGGKEGLASTFASALSSVSGSSRLIITGDDELTSKLESVFTGPITKVHTDHPPTKPDNKLTEVVSVSTHATKSRSTGMELKIMSANHRGIIHTPPTLRPYRHSLSLSIATALELGVNFGSLETQISKMHWQPTPYSHLVGDNNSRLIWDDQKPNMSRWESALETLRPLTDGDRILITTGISSLGRHRQRIYKRMVQKLRDQIDVLITYDRDLYRVALTENVRIECHLVTKWTQILPLVRERLTPGDSVLIQGEIPAQVVRELISD